MSLMMRCSVCGRKVHVVDAFSRCAKCVNLITDPLGTIPLFSDEELETLLAEDAVEPASG